MIHKITDKEKKILDNPYIHVEDFDVHHSTFYMTSDWHLLHKNIVLHEYEHRVQFIKDIDACKDIIPHLLYLHNNGISDDIKISQEKYILAEWLNSLFLEEKDRFVYRMTEEFLTKMYIDLSNDFLNISQTTKNYYVNLGDFFFHSGKKMHDNVLYNYTLENSKCPNNVYFQMLLLQGLISEYFDSSYFVYGNHDNIGKEYNQALNELSGAEEMNKCLIFKDDENKHIKVVTHIPLWTMLAEYEGIGNDRKFVSKYENDVLEYLLEKYHDEYTIDHHHGHIHSNELKPEIKYSLDNEDYIVQLKQNGPRTSAMLMMLQSMKCYNECWDWKEKQRQINHK